MLCDPVEGAAIEIGSRSPDRPCFRASSRKPIDHDVVANRIGGPVGRELGPHLIGEFLAPWSGVGFRGPDGLFRMTTQVGMDAVAHYRVGTRTAKDGLPERAVGSLSAGLQLHGAAAGELCRDGTRPEPGRGNGLHAGLAIAQSLGDTSVVEAALECALPAPLLNRRSIVEQVIDVRLAAMI